MKILFVSSEVFPIIKTGGLADVSGALPKALNALGEETRILMPGYRGVVEQLQGVHLVNRFHLNDTVGIVNLLLGMMPDETTPVYVIQNQYLYEREGGPYTDANGHDWQDNPLRFGTLAKVAAMMSSGFQSPDKSWIPDIVHCNDWQSGLTPAYVHYAKRATHAKHAKTLLSIHNLAFQGNFGHHWLRTLGLPEESYQAEGLEFYGHLSFLKAGVYYANYLSTVSPTYAQEIQTDAFGFSMQGLLQARQHQLRGILNGIDIDEWNPATDQYLPHHYHPQDMRNKARIKEDLQKRLHLSAQANTPLLGVVSRLTHQKGLDMLLEIADSLIYKGCQITVLGSGDKSLEHAYKQLATKHPGQVGVNIGYHEPLSHLMMAGSDIFIMPSRFEPCGLNQMYGLRYGTPSVVSRTGGLADSITDTHQSSLDDHTATGFIMPEISASALEQTIQRAVDYFNNPNLWQQIQTNGMQRPLDWESRAKEYKQLYEEMCTS